MTLPFYYSTKIKTQLSRNEIINILDQYTVTDNVASFKGKRATVINKQQYARSQKNYLYKATVRDQKFKIRRITGTGGGRSGNSFNPFCFGNISETEAGCEIRLKFRPYIMVMAFMLVYLAGITEGLFAILIDSLSNGKFKEALITPFALSPAFLAWWFFYRYGFKREVYRMLSFLQNIGISK